MIEVINNDFGSLSVQMEGGVPYLHLSLKKWSHSLYRAYKATFERFLAGMAALGHPVVFVAIPDNDEKLYRFERMFGFEEVMRADNQILLKRYTE